MKSSRLSLSEARLSAGVEGEVEGEGEGEVVLPYTVRVGEEHYQESEGWFMA